MRTELRPYNNTKIRVAGTFMDFGWNFYENKPTVLIKKIYHKNQWLTEHVWITISDELKEVELDKFDQIEFTTLIEEYTKDNGESGYSMQTMEDVSVIVKSGYRTDIEDIFDFSFIIGENDTAKRNFGKEEKEVDQKLNLPQYLKGIQNGEKMHVEFRAIKKDAFEFRFKTDSMHYYCSKLYFNPIKNGQSLYLWKNKIYIPKDIYRRLKELYFKVYYTKTSLNQGRFEPRKAFGKKDYLNIMNQVSDIFAT